MKSIDKNIAVLYYVIAEQYKLIGDVENG